MTKKRRTKQQKIIAKLKRQLQEKAKLKTAKVEKTAKAVKINKETVKVKIPAKEVFFSYSPKLIKKDLMKTIVLSLLFLGAIFLMQKFFHF